MIEAQAFIERARRQGFSHYTGVPCSCLTPFINCVINDERLCYISAANEGDAVAIAAGLTLGGRRAVAMMQNSGLGNAVNPLTSLAHTFAIPLLLIVTHRGRPGHRDEPQHELMGRITGDLFELMEIPWEPFPSIEQELDPALERANRYCAAQQRPYALLMNPGTVAEHTLMAETIPSRAGTKPQRTSLTNGPPHLSRAQALTEIISHTPLRDSVLIATTGYTGRELFAIDDRANQLYLVGSMGCASAFALGVSLARPELNITVVDGDGAALMRMGNFATIGSYAADNLTHVLLDNGMHESTGGQATVSANVSFADIAAACGYGLALDGNDLSALRELYARKDVAGARFAHLKIQAGVPARLPRPDSSPESVLRRLRRQLDAGAPNSSAC